MLLVGLTGNIASGKSLVAARLAAHGALVIDSDDLAREAVAPDTAGLSAIVGRWGRDVLQPDGTLDRARLRQIVFGDAAEREALEAIVHPVVEARRHEMVERARVSGVEVVVCDIPLLYETNLVDRFDLVVLVDAPEATRLDRLSARRGLTDTEARAMVDAQMASDTKRALADIVVANDGSLESLWAATEAVWEQLRSRAGRLS